MTINVVFGIMVVGDVLLLVYGLRTIWECLT